MSSTIKSAVFPCKDSQFKGYHKLATISEMPDKDANTQVVTRKCEWCGEEDSYREVVKKQTSTLMVDKDNELRQLAIQIIYGEKLAVGHDYDEGEKDITKAVELIKSRESKLVREARESVAYFYNDTKLDDSTVLRAIRKDNDVHLNQLQKEI